MNNIFLGIVIAGLSFLTFLLLIATGLRKKNKRTIYISIIFLLTTLLSGLLTGYLFVNKSHRIIKSVKFDNPFKPRTGSEIYTALFGIPKKNCVEVINKMDQIVPRLDCCIWLEFKTCPMELKRIIALENYEKRELLATDTTSYIPSYSPRPEWFKPNILGDSIIVMQKYNSENPNRDQILIFSKDSTYAFYCDMAE